MTKFVEPKRVAALLKEYHGSWMVAGGWAIDLFIGRETRDHQDIEIAIPRNEQLNLQAYLQGWELRYVVDGAFFPWEDGLFLELPIHEIHGKGPNDDDLEILFNEFEGEQWRFRRNLVIKYPAAKAIRVSPVDDIPMLSPEIALLYKAKWDEAKNYHDIQVCLPLLDQEQKNWLRKTIVIEHGSHPWLEFL